MSAGGNAHYFNNLSDATLIEYWNEGSGSISWMEDLETALKGRGYETRSTDPLDGRPRVAGERLVLTKP